MRISNINQQTNKKICGATGSGDGIPAALLDEWIVLFETFGITN